MKNIKNNKQMLFEMMHKVSGMALNENNLTTNDYGLVGINQSTLDISFKIYYVENNILTIKTNIHNSPSTLEIVKISENNFEAFGEPFATSEADAIKKGISIMLEQL